MSAPNPAGLVPTAPSAGAPPIWVLKIGGEACEDRNRLAAIAVSCARAKARLVVVHGGGSSVNRLQGAMGRSSRFVQGRRVTEPEDLELVEMALSGATNKRVVRALAHTGLRAVGISGSDGSLVRCSLVAELGRVGVPEVVSGDLLRTLLDSGFTPVVSPVSVGDDGEAVNVNADEVASALAESLHADRLLLISDVDGVRVRGATRSSVASHEVELLIASGEVDRGMIPKLRAAARAAVRGVSEVWIRGGNTGELDGPGGTRVFDEAEPGGEPPSVAAAPVAPDSNEQSLPKEAELLAGVFSYPRLLLVRGKGSYVWDSTGRRYLDFSSGLGVAALGHGRADFADLLRDQFLTLGHCSNLYGNLPVLELARRLVESSFASRVWFANSGTEANEAAIKFARAYGREQGAARKHEIVAFRGGFHGRTIGALAATHHPAYRRPFAPLMPGVRFAEFNNLESVEQAIHAGTCAVLVEPVQGEGGVIPAEPAFLERLRTLCDRHGALLIFDEVQCGMGRLGHLYAYQAYGVAPDMITLAKPMAAGYPLAAVLLSERVAAILKPGHHGSTFAGGPAACALGVKVFDEISRPEFLADVDARTRRLRAGLEDLAQTLPLYREARGRGLLQALVMKSRAPKPEEIIRRAREQGLLLTRAGERAIRFLPPLNTSEQEIDEALAILRRIS